MTQFIHARVEIAPGLSFVIDGNSKITAGNGTYADPKPNAFSLPAASVDGVANCPGSTPTCRSSCYVRGLAKHAPDVYAAYAENKRALQAVLASGGGYWIESACALGRWITEHASGGFRWHVSGDVWDTEHARWIAQVCYASPTVAHWIYTRTLEAVPELVRAPNLAVNVSADRDNADVAIAVARANGARVTYMAVPHMWARSGITEAICQKCGEIDSPERVVTDMPCMPRADLRDGDVVFPDYPLRGRDLVDPKPHAYWQNALLRLKIMTCPADYFGQSENVRCGLCDKCLKPAVRS